MNSGLFLAMTQSIRLSPSRASAPFPPETAVAASERSWASALARGAQGLLGRQAGDGFWYTELEGNVSLTTETVLLYRALGLHRPAQEAGFRQYLMSAQRPDGTFSLYEGGPADLSMTVEGYWGLKLLGESVDSERMRRAREFILGAGGAQRTRVLTRIYLALFGQYPHDRLPYLPPEMMLMPAWTGLSIYELAIWARG
ncbi:MAG TPA: hypothetical protein VEY30_04450, partial [Myxococcaceae bacterium]|nr:hypothetical protein [Myxococcaceae bacterium]